MATVQLADIVIPAEFSNYVVQNSVIKSAFSRSGIIVPNSVMAEQLAAGADNFTVPHWLDLADDEADIVNDDPDDEAAPRKIGTGRQVVRKSFLHGSWSSMNLASELSGDNPIARIQSRVADYWTRQVQKRLVSSLQGVILSNIANDDGDMFLNVALAPTTAGGSAFVYHILEAAATLGDAMRDLTGIAMHSDTYLHILKNDLIETLPDSAGGFIQTFRGMAVIVDDGLPKIKVVDEVGPPEVSHFEYVTVLFGPGAVGYAMAPPRIAAGTEVENKPGSGNGGGQQILHSRTNLAVHPLGFKWLEGSVAAESPTIAELALAANWERVIERKAVPIAFLRHSTLSE